MKICNELPEPPYNQQHNSAMEAKFTENTKK